MKKDNEYLDSMQNAIQKILQDTNMQQQNKIMQVYIKAFEDCFGDYLKKLKRGKTPSKQYFMKCKLAYINQLYDEIQRQSLICNTQVPANILEQYSSVITDITDITKDVATIKIIKNAVKITSNKIVEQLVKGEIYKNGIGLDTRLWQSVNYAGNKIEDAIASCFARGIGSVESANIIKEFAKKGHHTWDRKKIREKLGPGYASKYGAGGIDYESLRLMRTTTTHMGQLAVINSDKVNPYSQGCIYRTGHAGSRTCQMCKDRDGKFFKLDEVPLDHPNGLCHLEPWLSTDGKHPASLVDIVNDMNNYYEGKPNSGLMDRLA